MKEKYPSGRREDNQRFLQSRPHAGKRQQATLPEKAADLNRLLANAEAVIIGAGAGLSTSAGFTYSGERFKEYFSDFAEAFGITDMYSGGFYPFPSAEVRWAWWSRNIWINRYAPAPKAVYRDLLKLVQEKDYFVLTTNVDHQFQQAGFEKQRLFYTQGDYGLWQCSRPCHDKTYDNRETVREMLLAQGFLIESDDSLTLPQEGGLKMSVPTELIPCCPVCGEPMEMNLRCDSTFVEDAGWHEADGRYREFLQGYAARPVLFLELGTGYNTPGIIKFPFWRMVSAWPSRTVRLPQPGAGGRA